MGLGKLLGNTNVLPTPPVRVTVNGYAYRNTIAVMGGKYMVGVSAEHRASAGVGGGDVVDVDIELDDAPRTVEVPPELAMALARDKAAKATSVVGGLRTGDIVRDIVRAVV